MRLLEGFRVLAPVEVQQLHTLMLSQVDLVDVYVDQWGCKRLTSFVLRRFRSGIMKFRDLWDYWAVTVALQITGCKCCSSVGVMVVLQDTCLNFLMSKMIELWADEPETEAGSDDEVRDDDHDDDDDYDDERGAGNAAPGPAAVGEAPGPPADNAADAVVPRDLEMEFDEVAWLADRDDYMEDIHEPHGLAKEADESPAAAHADDYLEDIQESHGLAKEAESSNPKVSEDVPHEVPLKVPEMAPQPPAKEDPPALVSKPAVNKPPRTELMAKLALLQRPPCI